MSSTVNIVDMGADPTGVNPSDQALADAIATNKPIIYAPEGRYRFTVKPNFVRPLSVPPVELKGDGGSYRREATTFFFDPGANLTLTGPPGGDANQPSCVGVYIHDIGIESTEANMVPAVDIHTRVQMERISIVKWGQNGIILDGRASEFRNCNGWALRDIWLEDVGMSGYFAVYSRGSDAGDGLAQGIHVRTSGGGIYDSSFLGSTWETCSIELAMAGLPGYKCDKARSLFIACKEELGSPPNEIGLPAWWIGEMPPNGIIAPPGMQRCRISTPNGELNGLQSENKFSTRLVLSQLATPNDGRTVLRFQDKTPATGAPSGDPDDHEIWSDEDMYQFTRNRHKSRTAMAWTRARHAMGPDQIIMPNGVNLAYTNDARIIRSATQPADTVGQVGWLALAPNPTATFDGWRKVPGGATGTWRPIAFAVGVP